MEGKLSAPRWSTPGTVSARGSIWAFVIYCLYQGSGIVIGGQIRWTSAGYTYLKEVPGAPESWGWALVLLGALLGAASLLTHWYLKAVALTGICVWSLGFSVGAHIATAAIPTVGSTGGPAHLLIMVLGAILIVPDESRKAI